MKYYKVKPDCNQLPIYTDGRHKGVLIANELYTQKEVDNKFSNWMSYKMCFDEIEIPKNKTIFIFGCRKEQTLN
jgi:hypothetical protein